MARMCGGLVYLRRRETVIKEPAQVDQIRRVEEDIGLTTARVGTQHTRRTQHGVRFRSWAEGCAAAHARMGRAFAPRRARAYVEHRL